MKTLVITGANRGIGLELVKQYLQEGWQVIAGCRAPESAPDLNALNETGSLMVMPLDVANATSRESFCRAIGGMPVHLFINNAGVYGPKHSALGNIDESVWMDVLRVNSVAPLKMVELLQQNLVAAGNATIAVLSSKMGSMGDNGSGGSYIYRSSKAAINAVVKSLSVDLADDKIKVVALHPGWVQTDMGGPNALINVQTSVSGLKRVINNLTDQQSGSFMSYDGTLIPW